MQKFNVAVPFPSGACGSRRVPLGGFAARGAEDDFNDDVENVDRCCSYPAFFVKSVVWKQHFYDLMQRGMKPLQFVTLSSCLLKMERCA